MTYYYRLLVFDNAPDFFGNSKRLRTNGPDALIFTNRKSLDLYVEDISWCLGLHAGRYNPVIGASGSLQWQSKLKFVAEHAIQEVGPPSLRFVKSTRRVLLVK